MFTSSSSPSRVPGCAFEDVELRGDDSPKGDVEIIGAGDDRPFPFATKLDEEGAPWPNRGVGELQ